MYKAKSQKYFIYKQKDQKSYENIQENKKEKVEIIHQKYNVKAKFDLKMNKDDLEEIEKLEKKYLQQLFNKNVKEVKFECPFDAGIEIRDLSLHAKGPDEDKVFALNPKLWLNIRRGNTILDFFDT